MHQKLKVSRLIVGRFHHQAQSRPTFEPSDAGSSTSLIAVLGRSHRKSVPNYSKVAEKWDYHVFVSPKLNSLQLRFGH